MSIKGTNIKGGAAVITLIVLFAIILLLAAPIQFFGGWLIGVFAKLTIGDLIVKGAAALGLTLAKADIPIAFGFLSLVGGIIGTNVGTFAKYKSNHD